MVDWMYASTPVILPSSCTVMLVLSLAAYSWRTRSAPNNPFHAARVVRTLEHSGLLGYFQVFTDKREALASFSALPQV